MNKSDLRYVKTEENILACFKDCVKERGFDKTTVAEICARAKISRNTFYAHYEDKYGLLDKLFKEFEERFYKSLDPQGIQDMLHCDTYRNTAWYIENVLNNKEEMFFLVKCSQKRMEETLYKVVVDRLLHEGIPNYQNKVVDPLILLELRYCFGGTISFTNYWIQHYNEFSKDEVIEELASLQSKAVRRVLRKLLR